VSHQARPRVKNRGADLLVAALRAHGVRHVMGLTGGAIMETMDALHSNEELELDIFQTEAGAAWAAIGYARVTGQAGVCVVTSGPGATNTVTALADAHRDNVPLLMVTGQVPSFARYTDAFQETNFAEIAAPAVKKVFCLSRADDIVGTVAAAFRTALDGRPGPVLIDFTKDAQQARVEPGEMIAALAPPTYPHLQPCDRPVPEDSIAEVAHLLSRASRPAIILGYGLVLAKAEGALRELLRLVPCPVVHTLPAKPGLESDHPLNYGMLGMHGFYVANWIVEHSDLLISLGARYDDRVTGNLDTFASKAKRLVHFDIDPDQITKVLPQRKLPVVGDLSDTLPALIGKLGGARYSFPSWLAEIDCIRDRHPSTYTKDPDVIQAQYVMEVLSDLIEEQQANSHPVIFSTEVGDHQMWAGQFLKIRDNTFFMSSSGQGAMGSGLPMAIGAQLARPNALVVCLAGDGSLRMSEAELETIATRHLPVKIVLFNNQGYGIVRMWNHLFYEGRETGVIKCQKDWALLARANGFAECTVQSVAALQPLREALRSALFDARPHFLEVITPYEECLPLMPPGKPFEEIIVQKASASRTGECTVVLRS